MKSLSRLYPPSVSRHLAGVLARRVVPFGVAAILISCGENVTAPPKSRTLTLPSAPQPDIIVMERTVDIAEHDGVAAVHRVTRETLTAQTRLASEGTTSAESKSPIRASGYDAEHLPRPPIALPARYETAMCSALPKWSRSMSTAGRAGTIRLTGVGDAPASAFQVVRDGETIATVERSWVRASTSWQLARQQISTPDGRFREVITYEHRSASGAVLHNKIPVANCAPSSGALDPLSAAASRSFYAPRVNAFTPGATHGTGASRYTSNECLWAFDGDACFDKQNDVYAAEAVVAAAWAAMILACEPILVPVKSPVCAAAVITYVGSLGNLYFRERSLRNCRREQEEKKAACSCTGLNLFSRGTFDPSRASRSISPGTGGGHTGPVGLLAGETCSSGETGSGTGLGEISLAIGGPAGAWDCGYAAWEISYDGGETWEYFGTFWTCVYVS